MTRRRIMLAFASLLAGCSAFSAPGWYGPPSDHFDGVRFQNQRDYPPVSFLQWQLTGSGGPWPEWIDAAPGPAPPTRVERGIRVTFVNHSTLLVQIDGVNVLTDPIWSERPTPVTGFGPKRHRPPGIRFADLPPIDAVILSHNHYDHTDLPTLRALEVHSGPRVYGGLGQGYLFEQEGIAYAADMDWWQSVALSEEVTLTMVPAQHFSGRGLDDRDETLWAGYVLRGPSGSVYFAGDTGWGPHFEQIRERLGPPDVALLPIGAYQPRWFMRSAHISPIEAVRAHLVLRAKHSVPIHHGTFDLADEAYADPIDDLSAAIERVGLGKGEWWILDFGEGRSLGDGSR